MARAAPHAKPRSPEVSGGVQKRHFSIFQSKHKRDLRASHDNGITNSIRQVNTTPRKYSLVELSNVPLTSSQKGLVIASSPYQLTCLTIGQDLSARE